MKEGRKMADWAIKGQSESVVLSCPSTAPLELRTMATVKMSWTFLVSLVSLTAFHQGQGTVPRYRAQQWGKPTAQDDADIQGRVAYFLDEGKRIARERIEQTLAVDARVAGTRPIGQQSFSGVAAFLGSSTDAKRMSLPSRQLLETFQVLKNQFKLSRVADIEEVMRNAPDILSRNPVTARPDMAFSDVRVDFDTCPFPEDSEEAIQNCDKSAPFRTIDGSCNNLRNPLQGRSLTPFIRILDPDYCDGIGCPRRSKQNETLPSARLVSWKLFRSRPQRSHVHTHLLMTVGQFLDHDLTKTAVTKLSKDATGGGALSDVTCGTDGCSTEGDENRACVPIAIPVEDTSFVPRTCLMFVRTQEATDRKCKNGPRQQLNQLTHYIDASNMYGSTREQAEGLRDKDVGHGRLGSTPNSNSKFKPLLPQDENPDCRDVNSTVKCFKAGDARVNENIALTGIHSVMMRLHNFIEDQLHALNPDWSGERLYQETRKIVGALWQHIVYNEYLPLILGPQIMHKFRLSLLPRGYSTAYDPTISAEMANVFATAAFRFAHSMISDTVNFNNPFYNQSESIELSSVLRRPYEVYNNGRPGGSGIDSILHGLMSQRASQVDRFFTPEVTVRLFAAKPPMGSGTDLASLNIQRGRDHGLPGYNKWRQVCGLSVAHNFNDMSDITDGEAKNILKDLYDDVDDIDLFAGAMSEKLVPAGMVGPTFACILATQFRNAKLGDRFWYENGNSETKFTPGQLTEIRKVTLATVFCKTLDHVESIQKHVMLQPITEALKNLGGPKYVEAYSLASLYHGTRNERRSCDELPDIDLSKWKE